MSVGPAVAAHSVWAWSASLAVPGMLWALAAVSIPVVIHLLSRRRATLVPWGAMQFLELGRRARRRFQWSELLLMGGRMLLLALVALAAARPLFAPSSTGTAGASGLDGSPQFLGAAAGDPRDVVLILDGSASMGMETGETTPRQQAIEWARTFIRRLPEGSAVALLDARERVRPLLDPLNQDRALADEVLAEAAAPRGDSDLAASLSEALRILEKGRNGRRDVLILSDGQRSAWRPGETTRWSLLRELYHAAEHAGQVRPSIWAVNLASGQAAASDASLAPLVIDRGLVPTGLPVSVRTAVLNRGDQPLERTAELLLDEVPVSGSSQNVGPVPSGGQVPIRFEVIPGSPGSHRLTVRLQGGDGDPLAANDQAEITLEAAEGLPVTLVDGGQPGQGPFQGPLDFVRAALSPADDPAPAVRASVLSPSRLTIDAVKNARVLVLGSVANLEPPQVEAVVAVLNAGGGLLIVPGEKASASLYARDDLLGETGWLPAKLGEPRGKLAPRRADVPVIAHLDPRSFTGPVMPEFGEGDDPALARAGLFWYRTLEPVPHALVSARLDEGGAWLVEKTVGRARVAMLASSLDAQGGTLPANPDFVPWLHTLIFHLAESGAGSGARLFQAGEPVRLEIPIRSSARVEPGKLEVHTPDGRTIQAELTAREGRARIAFDDSFEPGVYRIDPPPRGGLEGPVYVQVASDPHESDPAPLEPAEAARLGEGWPLRFAPSLDSLSEQVLSEPGGGTRPVWRWLVLLALAGLCLEVLATRRLARARGLTAERAAA